MSAEEWRQVRDFPAYEVSSHGRVRRNGTIRKPQVITSSRDKSRCYLKVGLWDAGKRTMFFVHRLVAFAFLPAPLADQRDVCHIDHDSFNNHASNLRWDSHSANIAATYSPEAMERRAMLEESLGLTSSSFSNTDPEVPF